jgi:anti-anti-sigma factor
MRNESDGLDVQVARREGQVVVTPRGEVDLSTAPLLEAALRNATREPRAPVVVDMSDTDFLACCGLSVLDTTRATLAGAGLPLVVTGVRGSVRRLLHMAHDAGDGTAET